MHLAITFRNFEASESLKDHTRERLERLANVYCPVLVLTDEPVTAAALAGALAHNPDVVHGPVGADGLTEAALLAVLGPWLQRQSA